MGIPADNSEVQQVAQPAPPQTNGQTPPPAENSDEFDYSDFDLDE